MNVSKYCQFCFQHRELLGREANLETTTYGPGCEVNRVKKPNRVERFLRFVGSDSKCDSERNKKDSGLLRNGPFKRCPLSNMTVLGCFNFCQLNCSETIKALVSTSNKRRAQDQFGVL